MFGQIEIAKHLFAAAAALALSLTSTLVAIGPIDAPAGAPEIAVALDRDGSPANRTERA
ncbi:MAG: hypothetical protein ABR601_05270 [Parasphingopyxis sp.]|nr:hypothetical protein [Sphingomonadales bacterium]